MTAELLLSHVTSDANTKAWLKLRGAGIGASEIAAVMGVSPWESPFSLWWRKRLALDVDPTDEMATGTFLEPRIADWFERYHAAPAELEVESGGLYASCDRPWQLATPDRLLNAYGDCGTECDTLDGKLCQQCLTKRLAGVLECKWVSHAWDGWGEPGTADVPVHYRAQVQWQMDVMEVNSAVICALGPGGFRVYYLMRDNADIAAMREAGGRFMRSLHAGEPPNVDDHTATLPMVRRLNDAIVDREQEVPAMVAAGWLRSKRFKDLADRVERRYSANIRAHMGNAKTAVYEGRPIAYRTNADQLRRKAYR